MVYLDHLLPNRQPARPKKKDRERFVTSVMDALRDWRFSPFQNEAETRHAVRNYFIGVGDRWELSDAEAASLIAIAFDRMGVKRPTWAEGQWQYTLGREQCLWCAKAIDEEDQAKGRRFCSPMCAKSSLEKRVRTTRTDDDFIYIRALVEIAHAKAPPRPCQHCGTMFQSRFHSRMYCSTKCHDAARRFPDIACQWCGDMFHPRDKHKKYCSKDCADHGFIRTREDRLPEISCECCRAVFRPKTSFAMYCSDRCKKDVHNARVRLARRRGNVIYLTAEIFDSWFREAA